MTVITPGRLLIGNSMSLALSLMAKDQLKKLIFEIR